MVDKYTIFLLSLYFLDYIFLIERVFVHAYCHYPPQKTGLSATTDRPALLLS